MIACDEIMQTGNELMAAFDGCKNPKNSDLVKLVDLVMSVYKCQGGGANYNTIITETYSEPQEVIFPPKTIHSYSLNVMQGSIIYGGFDFPQGSTRNIEFTTTNKQAVSFTVNENSIVFIEYIIEDVEEII